MAVSKNFSVLEQTEDGRSLEFNRQEFALNLRIRAEAAKKNGTLKGDYYAKLASDLGVAADTVRDWSRGHCAPSDLSTVQRLAELWDLSDYHQLLREKDARGAGVDAGCGTKHDEVPSLVRSCFAMKAAREMYAHLMDTIQDYYDLYAVENLDTVMEEDPKDLFRYCIFPDYSDPEATNDLYRRNLKHLSEMALDISPELRRRIMGFLKELLPDRDLNYLYIPCSVVAMNDYEEGDEEYPEYLEYLETIKSYGYKADCGSARLDYVTRRCDAFREKLLDVFRDYLAYTPEPPKSGAGQEGGAG